MNTGLNFSNKPTENSANTSAQGVTKLSSSNYLQPSPRNKEQGLEVSEYIWKQKDSIESSSQQTMERAAKTEVETANLRDF